MSFKTYLKFFALLFIPIIVMAYGISALIGLIQSEALKFVVMFACVAAVGYPMNKWIDFLIEGKWL